MTTLRDIARRSGVSVSTASRALSGQVYVGRDTRARVEAVAKELGYRPNALARGLRRSQTRTVGLLVPDILNASYAFAAAALQGLFQDFGYGLVLYVSKNEPETDRRCLDRLHEQQVDGLLHVPCTAAGSHSLREDPRPIPVVEFFRRSPSNEFDAVLYDEDVGAQKLITHLLELGHRRIGVIAGPRHLGSTKRRMKGVHRAIADFALEADVLQVLHGEYAPETGRQALRRLLDGPSKPTAIFATSAQFALGLAMAARERRIVIPDQISLAGFGDPEWYQLVEPPITTYTRPLREMGMTAAQLLISRMEQNGAPYSPTQILISGSLIIRNSTAPPGS